MAKTENQRTVARTTQAVLDTLTPDPAFEWQWLAIRFTEGQLLFLQKVGPERFTLLDHNPLTDPVFNTTQMVDLLTGTAVPEGLVDMLAGHPVDADSGVAQMYALADRLMLGERTDEYTLVIDQAS